MSVLLITPPMLQFNAPYAATPRLAAWLRARGVEVEQADLSLELALRLFSRRGVAATAKALPRRSSSPSVQYFRRHRARYVAAVDDVVRFLQGRASELAARILTRRWLPEGPRFAQLAETGDTLDLSPDEFARHLASLFIDDLADVVRDGVDARFGLARYADHLAVAATSFEPLSAALASPPTLVDRLLEKITVEVIRRTRPALVGLTVPFPGNLYGALRIAQTIRRVAPRTRIALGGGYVNTELRELAEPCLFDFVDFVTLDDGEQPLACIVEHLHGRRRVQRLCRTFVREQGRVVFHDAVGARAPRFRELPVPSYAGLDARRYLAMIEQPNPMLRLWSDGFWNRLTLAHGCCWHRCAFCDTCLGYIRDFDPNTPDRLVDQIEQIMAETGISDFHFVDEAAPPALLGVLAERLLARGVRIRWWANIRFERAFTPELCGKLACSGCLAVTAGLETAHDRTLRLMQKGVTVVQAARVARACAEAGILVHVYLMYGFPTQTLAETRTGLEVIRRWFAAGWIQSAYWHRFALTAHSAIAREPKRFGIRLLPHTSTFALNEIPFVERRAPNWDKIGVALRKATFNFMHGVGLDWPVRRWFS
ncbi:MAG: radical SAM protein [Kiritimatiellaeota bacterium]|nr:radical SAM protein [Kiritimatiellota bacterium]